MNSHQDIHDLLHRMKREGNAFAVATVVRTLSVTAAKPGAKAIIDCDGDIIDGWIGGGCARSAVVKAAKASIADGEPRFVSLQPDELLKEQGLSAGVEVDGRLVAKNMCPSKGTMEIFIEPFLANPELIVVGSSPVAASLRQLSGLFNFGVSVVGGVEDLRAGESPIENSQNHSQNHSLKHSLDTSHANSHEHTKSRYAQWGDVPMIHGHRYIVVATQGAGDFDALASALKVQSRFIAFVGSQRKMLHLKNRLVAQQEDAAGVNRIKGPAGLDIGAVTPHEIALSILAELVQIRRTNLKTTNE